MWPSSFKVTNASRGSASTLSIMRASITTERLRWWSGDAGELPDVRILVITSCTGKKEVSHERRLTLKDFRKGAEHIGRREEALRALMRPAEELYAGEQHVRLMRGVAAF